MTLYEVPDPAAEPLQIDELRERGNRLVTDARKGAAKALQASAATTGMWLDAYKLRDIRRFRDEAREAARMWQKVDGLLSELVRECERTAETR